MKQFMIIAVISVICSSCFHVYYSPNTANTPLLTEKGEVRFNAAIGSGGNSELTSGELQVAYAVSKRFGFMANGFAGGTSDNTGSYEESGNGTYIEIAPGYFMPLSTNKKWMFEVYGGIGFGRVKNEYGLNDYSKVGVTKPFLQPAIGYKSRLFEIALAPKISFINWKVKEERITSPEHNYDRDVVARIKSKPTFTSFEPALIIRGGGEKIKAQLGLSFSTSNDFYGLSEVQETGLASLGISINMGNRKKQP